MSQKTSQKGFSAIEAILVVLVIGLIVAVGWLVWDKQNSVNKAANDSSTSEEAQDAAAVAITEWGIKLNTTHANELTYEVSDESGVLEASGDAYDSIVVFAIKPDLITDADCSPGVNLYRLTGSPADNENAVKIGDTYYTTFGAPGTCANDADTDLAAAIVSDIAVENLETL